MNKIREARKAQGISVHKLGELVGVKGASISRYENGQRMPSVKMAKKLSEVLGVPWYELIDTEEKAS